MLQPEANTPAASMQRLVMAPSASTVATSTELLGLLFAPLQVAKSLTLSSKAYGCLIRRSR
jgi:hypothetical protein